MIVCGIEMKASEARLALIDGTRAHFTPIDVKPRKLSVADDESAGEMRAFRDAIFAYFRENAVERIAIKKRGKSGEYAGGAVGFKLESVIQLYDQCEVVLISPQTVAAALRNHPISTPEALPKYQEGAFQTAYASLA